MLTRSHSRLGSLLILALGFGAASCSRCGGQSATTGSESASSDVKASSEVAASSSAPALPADAPAEVPEVKDAGPGRATAALRAALKAYGIPYDDATLEKDAKVDEEGASIDDLEDVANRAGLDAKQIVLPREHALLAESKVLPAITILETAEGDRDFVLLWRRDGDRIEVMDPTVGRTWMNRADIDKRLHVEPEVTINAADWTTAESAPAYRDALRARMEAKGVSHEAAAHRLADANEGSIGALDAIMRQVETDPSKAGSDVDGFIDKELPCELDDKCDGVTRVPDTLWSARPALSAANGMAQVRVRGAVMLVIAGKKAVNAQ